VIVLLDSTVLIDHLRNRPAAARVEATARAGDVLATTAINVEEVVRGLRPDEQAAADTLFAGLVVLPIGLDEGRRAGTWRREFGARGITLSQADCLIAAAAASVGARLATGNPKDFPMPELVIDHWPVG
jgi:predicted nucleic acid-binding protein